jgi:succinoglycan biosynthesis protein ExoM
MSQLPKQPARSPDISVCIITYKRPAQLGILLESLVQQELPSGVSFEVVIVDNDLQASARTVVRAFRQAYPAVEVTYEVEPCQGIPLARNRSVRLSGGNFIAFIDDDEWAAPGWFAAHWKGMQTGNADALFGPVIPVLPDAAPRWIRHGNFFDRPMHANGAIVAHGRTGNALVQSHWLTRFENPFDPALRLTGGEDADFFNRIRAAGATLRWAEDALVYEAVGKERLCLRWLLMRAFRGGQGFAWRHAVDRPIPFRLYHCLYRSLLACVSLTMSVVMLPFGISRSVWWICKLFASAGQLSAYLPFRYEEYRPENYR